jgi:hypothetical protein
MACLVPQGGEQRKWFRGRGFSGGGRWRLGAEVTGGPDRAGGVECVSAAASRESMTTTKPVSADRTACRTTVGSAYSTAFFGGKGAPSFSRSVPDAAATAPDADEPAGWLLRRRDRANRPRPGAGVTETPGTPAGRRPLPRAGAFIGAPLSGHVTFVQNPPQLLLWNESRSLPEDGAKSTEIELVVSRDGQSLVRTAGDTPKLDVASSLRDRHESELPEDPDEFATREPTKLRHTPARSPA